MVAVCDPVDQLYELNVPQLSVTEDPVQIVEEPVITGAGLLLTVMESMGEI